MRSVHLAYLAVKAMATLDDAILVAEDDTLVRMILVSELQRQGYRVIEAEDGDQAVRWLSKLGKPAALVTDIQMPGKDGLEVAQAARERWPGLPVLFVSGAANAAEMTATVKGSQLLPKPFEVDMLLQHLSDLIDVDLDE